MRYLYACMALGLALAIGLDLTWFPDHPKFPDERRFLAEAEAWARLRQFRTWDDRAWEMPLASMWFYILGGKMLTIRLAQAFLVPAQAWMVYDLSKRLFGQRSGKIAGCVTALYPFFLFYQGLALSETLFTTLLLGSMCALYRWVPK